MPKILVVCRDVNYCAKLLVYFEPYPEFQLCLTENEGIATVERAIEIKPELVVLELEPERLVIAGAFKLLMPDVPVFVIAPTSWEFEKEALSAGVDAVFDKDGDIAAVIENARAALA